MKHTYNNIWLWCHKSNLGCAMNSGAYIIHDFICEGLMTHKPYIILLYLIKALLDKNIDIST